MFNRNKDTQPQNRFKTPSIQRILTSLLILFCVLLGLSIYFRSHPIKVEAPEPAIENLPEEKETDKTPPDSDPSEPANNTGDDTETAGENISEPEETPLPSALTDPNSVTVLVNKNHSLKADFVPSDLSEPYVNSTGDVIQISSKAAESLKEMINAAKEADIQIYLTSGYVSYDTQEDYYTDRVTLVGEAEANRIIAKAGFSEHQTGLAVDFSNEPTGMGITSAFAETAAGKWLYEHAYEYGFILRYPEGKESITGYTWQPWHYRYVGSDVSGAMHAVSPDLTFEEYYHIEN